MTALKEMSVSDRIDSASGADVRFVVAAKGAQWAVWQKRDGRFPRIISTHRTESAAIKAKARAMSNLDRKPDTEAPGANVSTCLTVESSPLSDSGASK